MVPVDFAVAFFIIDIAVEALSASVEMAEASVDQARMVCAYWQMQRRRTVTAFRVDCFSVHPFVLLHPFEQAKYVFVALLSLYGLPYCRIHRVAARIWKRPYRTSLYRLLGRFGICSYRAVCHCSDGSSTPFDFPRQARSR